MAGNYVDTCQKRDFRFKKYYTIFNTKQFAFMTFSFVFQFAKNSIKKY